MKTAVNDMCGFVPSVLSRPKHFNLSCNEGGRGFDSLKKERYLILSIPFQRRDIQIIRTNNSLYIEVACE